MTPVVVRGKNLAVSEPLRDYIEDKIGKLERHLELPVETTVEVSQGTARGGEGHYVVQVTILVDGSILRGEEKGAEAQEAVDAVVNVMNRQIERYKGKRFFRKRRGGQARIAEAVAASEEVEEEELAEEEEPEAITAKVVRRKRFAMKPMFAEEAADELELLGHGFYFFLNAATGQYNVIYRRQDGDYGLIEPEMA